MESGQPNKRKAQKLTREDWVDAARQLLISEGVQGLSLRRVASSLNVTTGAFYWLYGNFDELLDHLREHWKTENSRHFNLVFDDRKLDCREKYLRYLRILFDTSLYDPTYDGAIRDWARSSTETNRILQEVEQRRIDQLQSMYESFGYKGTAALVHAQLAYFHQVGYYAVGVPETLEERLAKIPYYAELVCPGIIPLDIAPDDLKRMIFEDRTDRTKMSA